MKTMKDKEKRNLTKIFERSGGLVHKMSGPDGSTYHVYLVPSGSRPGYRTGHVFICPDLSSMELT